MDKKANRIDDWSRMITGKLYNSASADIAKQHACGLIGCDRFNRIAVWRKKKKQSAPITIKDGYWICSSTTICGGVTIGENSIVAAGSVVLRDVSPNSIVAGIPAKVLRKIDEDDRMNVWETYMKNEEPVSIRKRKNQ